MNGYGIYNPGARAFGGRSQDDATPEYGVSGDAKGAAISVAVMIVGAALFLTILKRSGFRAMVAVGRS